MLTQQLEREVLEVGLKQKAQAYFQLLKFRLSLTVAFSSAIGFMLGGFGHQLGGSAPDHDGWFAGNRFGQYHKPDH